MWIERNCLIDSRIKGSGSILKRFREKFNDEILIFRIKRGILAKDSFLLARVEDY